MLTISVEDLGKNVILRCAGRFVRGEETTILCTALHHRGRDIALDLERVDSIDGDGVGALIALQAAGIYLRLMNPTRLVREALRAAHLDSIFDIDESQTEQGIVGGMEAAIAV